jgi:hypothetical protein
MLNKKLDQHFLKKLLLFPKKSRAQHSLRKNKPNIFLEKVDLTFFGIFSPTSADNGDSKPHAGGGGVDLTTLIRLHESKLWTLRYRKIVFIY